MGQFVGLAGGRCVRGWVTLIALAAMFLVAAPASASAESLTVSATPFQATEGQQLVATSVATFFDSVGGDTATDYAASINWGDGSTSAGTVSATGDPSRPWVVEGTHTFAEEGSYVVVVTVNDTASSAQGSASFVASVADAPLSLPGGSPTAGPPVLTTGSGSASTANAVASFEGSIGGIDHGTTTGEQSGGYRHITWDAVTLDGSDPGSRIITPNHVVAIATNRAQPWGLQLSRSLAVANDGFASVNTGLGGRLTPYSAPNIAAPFNSNRVQMQVVAPASQASSTVPAATRGLGIVFLNVWQANTTSIEYFSGNALLYTAYAPVGGVGEPSFVGALFASPAVTQIVVNLGSAAIFSFDGSTVTPGPADSQTSGTNLMAADDVVLAEPTNPQATLNGTAGVPVTGVLDNFTDTDPSGNAGDYAAVVNWEDGTQSNAPVIGPPGGTFSVTGAHTYAKAGTYQVSVNVTDFGGSTQNGHVTLDIASNPTTTNVSCSPSRDAVGNPSTCTATVTDTGPGGAVTPTGTIGFSSPTRGASFSNGSSCKLVPTPTAGLASCAALFTPGRRPPKKAKVVAGYQGDPAHTSSQGSVTLSVERQRCTVKLPSKKISAHATRLTVIVDCNIKANVGVKAVAHISGRPNSKVALAHEYKGVSANRRTKLRIKIRQSKLKFLVQLAKKGHTITLQITLVANKATKPVKAKPVVTKVKL